MFSNVKAQLIITGFVFWSSKNKSQCTQNSPASRFFLYLGKPSEKKISLPLDFFRRGGGVMSESKSFEELFCSVHVWTFFQKGGGGCLNPNFLRNFSACVGKFFREGGGVTLFQKF